MRENMQPALQGNLLIVDDSPDDIALLMDYLRGSGLRLAVALDGREGYNKSLAFHPDLVLMDLRMPRTDGLAALRLLKSDPRTRDVPVIFLSGSNLLEDRLEALESGAVDYICKPFSPAEVKARVRVHLDIRRKLQGGEGETGDVPAADAAEARHASVVAAMQLLRKNLADVPALPELARQVGTNERRLTELFRQETGFSVFAWLREERFREACRLLSDSDLDVQQVALHIGYGSASNFITWFRDRVGVTPGEFRQARRAGAL